MMRAVLPPTGATSNSLPVYGTIYAHCSRTLIEGNGTQLACSTRDRCVVLGDLVSSNHYSGVNLRGVNLSSALNVDGCQVASTQRQSNLVTITVAGGCSTIQSGDVVNINFTDNPGYWGSHGPVTVSGTSITYSQTGANIALAVSPGTIVIQNAAIEDNALPGTIEQIQINATAGGKFSQGLVIDNDQAATIRNTDYNGGLLCTANHCGSYVYSAGTTAATPVIWVDKANWGMQCAGNGITDYANNGVKVTDSVVQGFGMWGINAQTLLGSFGATESDNVYMEEGAGPCVHPYAGSNFSAAGFIWFGNLQPLIINGGEQPGAHIPQFANSGSTQYNYYVVANDTNGSSTVHSFPLVAGFALTNGTGTISGQFPRIPPQSPGDTVTYDILRMQPSTGLVGNAPSFPVKGACTGGSTTACGSVITGQAQCSGLVCSFTDTASANTASYSINSITWLPVLPFWPGGIVVTGSGGAGSTSPVVTSGEPGAVVSVNGDLFPGVLVRGQCSYADNGGTSGGVWKQCLDYGTNSSGLGGVLFNDVAAPAGVKGKLNFQAQTIGGVNAHHFFTLVDSAPATTLATVGFRPPNNATDTYIGLDAATSLGNAQLAFGAPASISNYIGNSGDNSSYLERLTAGAKTFNVPVNVNGNLTVTGTCTGCGSGAVNSGSSTQLAVYPANGAAVSGDSRFTDSGSTLSYTGSNGISATAGSFSGNVTVNGQLLVAGPWTVSSPIPGTPMAASAAGTSALGISNDGNFYISANSGTPQKVATAATSSFFSNLFQEDGYDVGQFVVGETTTNPQSLHVYSSYTNSSTWQRTSLGYDLTDNYAVVRSENSTAGNAPGLGFWINNGLKWVVDATGNFKPWTDQSYNIGSFSGTGSGSGLRPGTVYVAGSATSNSGFELGKFANESYEICNDATTGTTLNQLAVLTTGGCAAKPGSALTSGAIGIVVAGAGTTGVATLARAGSAFCSFDANATVIGDYVVPSPTANGSLFPLCRDAGATRPTGTQILGRVLQASSGSTTVQMFLDMPGSNVSSSGAGAGSCSNQAVTAVLNGGPTCTTITSAYVDSSIATAASPVLTGTPTAPTAGANTNTTQVATTAFVLGQASSTTPNIDGTAAVGSSNTFARADHVHPTDTSRVGGGGNLVSGNYPKANATGTVTDSGVTAGPYATEWITAYRAGTATTFNTSGTKIELWGVTLQFPLNTGTLSYNVSGADATSNTYDLGIYSGAGALVAHTGAIAGSTAMTAGSHSVSWTGTNPKTLEPGKYYLAITTSCVSSCATLSGDGSSAVVTFLSAGTVTTGGTQGTLDSSITAPADAYTWSGSMISFIVR
jgi:hypothetical protein